MKIVIHAKRFRVVMEDGSLADLPYRIARFASFAAAAFIADNNRGRA